MYVELLNPFQKREIQGNWKLIAINTIRFSFASLVWSNAVHTTARPNTLHHCQHSNISHFIRHIHRSIETFHLRFFLSTNEIKFHKTHIKDPLIPRLALAWTKISLPLSHRYLFFQKSITVSPFLRRHNLISRRRKDR